MFYYKDNFFIQTQVSFEKRMQHTIWPSKNALKMEVSC